MAKSQYSADSASLPPPRLPSDGNKMGTSTPLIPASFLKNTLPVSTTFVLTDIGENADLGRRLPEHGSVRRKTGQSGTPSLIFID
jgi:hypothetical protein